MHADPPRPFKACHPLSTLNSQLPMPSIHISLTCPVFDSFHVRQIAGMFDVPIEDKLNTHVGLDVPKLGDDWRIGLIVGPSASGKTTVARKLFGRKLHRPKRWPRNRAV